MKGFKGIGGTGKKIFKNKVKCWQLGQKQFYNEEFG